MKRLDTLRVRGCRYAMRPDRQLTLLSRLPPTWSRPDLTAVITSQVSGYNARAAGALAGAAIEHWLERELIRRVNERGLPKYRRLG